MTGWKLKIKVLSKRPIRDTVISKDEIINLVIILNTTKSVKEFLEAINHHGL